MFVLSKKISKLRYLNRLYSSLCPVPPEVQYPVVTLLDVSSAIGANLALLLKQNHLVFELRVFDEKRNCASLAADLNDIDTSTKVIPHVSLKQAVKGAHIVISTGGCQQKPGQTQKQLFEQNLDNVRNVAIFLSEFNPSAIYCIAKPPVESLVPMASEEYKKAGTYDPRKIIGVTTHVSMVANKFVARYLRVDPSQVICPVIGGLSTKTTIPVVSLMKPTVEYNGEVYGRLQEDVSNAEEALLRKGAMWCYSKAVAVARFIHLILRAVTGDDGCAECAFVAQTGHISEFLPYMTSIVKLGVDGVISTHMPKINELEIAELKAALPYIIENILLGTTYLNGDFDLPPQFRRKRKCDEHLKKKIENQ